MKKLFILVFIINNIFATTNLDKMDLIELFKNNYFTYICNHRWKYIIKYDKKREDLLSLVAYSCLKKRYLTPALDLAKVLTTTKVGRKNATYITTLFLMKKLMIQIIEDNIKISNLKLPIIKDNTLGIVFNELEKNKYIIKNNKIIITDKNLKYIISLSKDDNIIIEIYKNSKLILREFYW